MNPWELEVDPDFESTEDERQREQEAEARALRAQALALRRCSPPDPITTCAGLWSSRRGAIGAPKNEFVQSRRRWRLQLGGGCHAQTQVCFVRAADASFEYDGFVLSLILPMSA